MAYYTEERLDKMVSKRPLSYLMSRAISDSVVVPPKGTATTGLPRGSRDGDDGFYFRFGWEVAALSVGSFMEKTAELISAINDEIAESKARLEDLHNDVRTLADIILPALSQQAEALRTSRMTVVSEVTQSLVAMKEIRKFFFESNYEAEMARLERFVGLCREIQELKRNGVFDAVCDSAIRLAVQEK